MRELILGGQRSGKSRRAESMAVRWLAGETPGPVDRMRQAVLVATAEAHDDEMRERIARHKADREQRSPGLATLEVPRALPAALRSQSAPHRLVVVDCLTLWLTNRLMPAAGEPESEVALEGAMAALCAAVSAATGPLVLVSNEIGLGVMPMGRETRRFVDELGRLHQRLAVLCDRVTLMVAGLPMTVKGLPSHD